MRSNLSRLRELFDEAFPLAAEQRSAFVEALDDRALADELRALLAASADSAGVLEPPAPLVDAPPTEGTQIGGYRLGVPIASGGMGIVFEAEQLSPRRRVALKMMRLGFDSPDAARRFRDEAELLARLRHPGIAQVFDAGVHVDRNARYGAERPWFAMEFVEGAADVVRFCQDHALAVEERLRLFAEVCDAVQHGHQRGVVHRDLKPDNILVDSAGQPKVIDFGVARTTNVDVQRTTLARTAGDIVGTLRYMSPEQLEGRSDLIDTRTDVHALGLVLYELLTGELPYALDDKPLAEIARIVRDVPPRRPSAAARPVTGDLELIVLQAIAKDPAQRYASAAALADDVRRYLSRETIAARPPSLRYQLRMFGRRHRALVAAGVLAFTVTLAAAIVSSVFWASEQERADEAERVTTFVEHLLRQGNPIYSRGESLTPDALLAVAAQELGQSMHERPAVRARLLGTVGTALVWLDDDQRGVPLLEQAIALRESAAGRDDERVLAWLLIRAQAADPATGEAICRDVLSRVRPHHPPYLLIRATGSLGMFVAELGRHAEAELLLRRSVELAEGQGAFEHARALARLGHYLAMRRESAVARSLFAQALAVWHGSYPDGNLAEIGVLRGIALCSRDLGELDAADAALARAQARAEQFYGADSARVADVLVDRAGVASRRVRYAEVRALLEQALAIQTARMPADDPQIARTRSDLAMLEAEVGDFAAARPLIAAALASLRARHPDGHSHLAIALCTAAKVAARSGELDRATALAEESLAMLERYAPGDRVRRALTRWVLGQVAYERGQLEHAEELLREVVADLAGEPGCAADCGSARLSLARVLNSRQRPDEALQQAENALRALRAVCGEDHDKVAFAHLLRGWALELRGAKAESVSAYRVSLATMRRALPDGHADLAWPLDHLGLALLDEAPSESVALIGEALAIRRQALAATSPRLLGTMLSLGRAHARCRDFEAAESIVLEAHRTILRELGASHGFAAASNRALAELYDAWGRPAEAQRYRD